MHRVIGALATLVAAACLFSSSAFATVRAGDPGQLIQSVASDVHDVVMDCPASRRADGMRQVLRRDFDLPYIASAALGEHWDQANEQQKARILAAFETMQAKAYADRLGSFKSVSVLGVGQKEPGVWAVDSNLKLASGHSMKVEWEVRGTPQDLRISDVKVSGVSLFLTQRAAFQSYIRSHGGAVEPLVQVLEARAAR